MITFPECRRDLLDAVLATLAPLGGQVFPELTGIMQPENVCAVDAGA